MEVKETIEKIHKETCDAILKKLSELTGNETKEELEIICDKCQCRQYQVLKFYDRICKRCGTKESDAEKFISPCCCFEKKYSKHKF